jgi:hypothetical protein
MISEKNVHASTVEVRNNAHLQEIASSFLQSSGVRSMIK